MRVVLQSMQIWPEGPHVKDRFGLHRSERGQWRSLQQCEDRNTHLQGWIHTHLLIFVAFEWVKIVSVRIQTFTGRSGPELSGVKNRLSQ